MRRPEASTARCLRWVLWLVVVWSCLSVVHAQVPSLAEMEGIWVDHAEEEFQDMPTMSNTVGSVGTSYDVVDTNSFVVPPLVSGG
jgi:hypothetical protein